MERPDNEPQQSSIERLLTEEERRILSDSKVPDETKAEIMERLERYREADLEDERGDEPG
jgi:hypothetical protein